MGVVQNSTSDAARCRLGYGSGTVSVAESVDVVVAVEVNIHMSEEVGWEAEKWL